MEAITEFFKSVLGQLDKADFALLALIDFSAFAAVFIAALACHIFSKKVRASDKRVYLYVVNAFTAVTLAIFLTQFTIAQSVAASSVFWLAGYLTYGLLCLLRPLRGLRVQTAEAGGAPITAVGVKPVHKQPAVQAQPAPSPAVQTGVRLEHAVSIADKLLLKNLGRGDRQELEKIKTALTVLKVKGALTAQEGEALNDMFNALLKLMAKYDL